MEKLHDFSAFNLAHIRPPLNPICYCHPKFSLLQKQSIWNFGVMGTNGETRKKEKTERGKPRINFKNGKAVEVFILFGLERLRLGQVGKPLMGIPLPWPFFLESFAIN